MAPKKQTAEELVAAAEALLQEIPLDFLAPKQKAELLKKNAKDAANKARRAIGISADLSAAHRVLGSALERSGDQIAAAASFLQAMDLASDDEPLAWADAAANSFAMLVACPGEQRPAWWNDDELLAHSARASELLPNAPHAQRFRAHVLAAPAELPLPPLAAPRGVEQLRDAAKHFERVAALAVADDEKRAAAEAGAVCLKNAASIERAGSGDGAEEDNATAAAAAAAAKNAAKNRKKKEQKAAKAAEKAAAEAAQAQTVAMDGSGGGGGGGDHGRGGVRYCWADPLPPENLASLAEIGVLAGALLTDADLAGIDAQGGPAEAIRCGLICQVDDDVLPRT